MQPRVGITPRLHPARGGAPERLERHPDVAAAVEAAGGVVVPLSPRGDDPARSARDLHALVIPGGPDFLPEVDGPASGASPYAGVAFDPVPRAQLDFDRAILDEARGLGLPILALCYGMQLLALADGGALHLHLPVDRPDALPHTGNGRDRVHPVEVEPDTRLAALLGAGRHEVNSRHHQAVSHAGPLLAVCARAPDGVIEAVERPDGPFCLGVQWHPERMPAPHRQAVFAGLVAAALP